MPDLELTANNPAFTPIDPDTHAPLPAELMQRVSEAMAKAHKANWSILGSANFRDWNPAGDRDRITSAKRAAIKAWNEEQVAKSIG